jgi:integrase/recombinase XerD
MSNKEFSGYLEPSEVRDIILKIPETSRNPDRDVLLAETLWQTGARVSEVPQLKPEHIGLTSLILPNEKQVKRVKDRDGKMIRIADPSATKVVEVSESLCRLLKDFCRREGISKGQYIFGATRAKNRPLGRRYIHRMISKASEAAGVFKAGKNNPKTGRQFKGAYPHLFRHANAMHLLEQTGNVSLVQKQLGHSSVATTQIYAYAKDPLIKRMVGEIDWSGVAPLPEKKRGKRKKKEGSNGN